jgi:glc operon protein GlcG
VALTLAEANSIVTAALARARQLAVHVSVAVCDASGRVIVLNRMDGSYADTNRFSIGKAVVSAGTGLPSGKVTGLVEPASTGVVVGEGAPQIRLPGGLPILRNGAIEGGCGVDGSLSSVQDEECARAGIAAVR